MLGGSITQGGRLIRNKVVEDTAALASWTICKMYLVWFTDWLALSQKSNTGSFQIAASSSYCENSLG